MTLFTLLKVNRMFISIFMIGVLSVLITGCSSSRNESEDVFNYEDEDGKKTYVFYDDGIEWEARLINDKITELYRDGKKIPDDKISSYEDKIYKRIAQTDEDMKDFHAGMQRQDFDMEDFHDEIAELQEEMKNKQYAFNFDHEKFSEDMQKAASEIRLAFESEEFKESMKKLNEELKDIKIDINSDELNEEIKRATSSIKDIHIDINTEALQEQIAEMQKELSEVNSELKHAKKYYRKYNKFMDDLRSGLYKDGIINDTHEDFDMTFNSKALVIDGKSVPDDIHKKYKEMYEERFGKMDDDMNIKTHE